MRKKRKKNLETIRYYFDMWVGKAAAISYNPSQTVSIEVLRLHPYSDLAS